MKTHLNKRKLNECSLGLFVYYFRRNELASILLWYILMLIAAPALPMTASLPLSHAPALLSFSLFFGKATLPFLVQLRLASPDQPANRFTPETLDAKQLNNLTEFRPIHNDGIGQKASHRVDRAAESIVRPNALRSPEDLPNFKNSEHDKSDHKLMIAKESIFPCLDSLEVSLFNLSQPLGNHHHLIRVYHSNELNKQSNASSQFGSESPPPLRADQQGRSSKYGPQDNQPTYVKEFTVSDPPSANAKYSIQCSVFDPVYLFYCFRYVSINQTNGQIRFESEDLYCLPTLLATLWQANRDHRRQEMRKTSHKNAELAKSNLANYSGGFGSSLRLYGAEQEEPANGRAAFDLNKANQHTQTKHVVCSCGQKSLLEARQASYRIRLTSGNGYCGGRSVAAGEEEATSKTLIKIRKLNFEFCFIDLTLPTWIEIKVKDVLLLDKKEQDLKQLGPDSLIIRDGQTYISPQLNYLHSFPTFHFVSSGLLRFESSSLGNQYTIELNQLSDRVDLATRKSGPAGHLESLEEDAYEGHEETKSEEHKRDRFMSERQAKMNHTKHTLRNRPDQSDFKGKLDQALNLKHLVARAGKRRTNKRADPNDEHLFVLLVDRDDRELLVDNEIALNQKIGRVLSEIHRSNSSSYEALLQDVERQESSRRLILHLIAILFVLLIGVSAAVFVWIFARTQTGLPTGNLIRFGLPNEHFLANTYQEVQSNNDSSNKSSIRSKQVRIDEERIYESCRTRTSTSDQEESDSPNDLLNDTEDGSENELEHLSKSGPGSEEFSNSETLKNETVAYKSSFKNDFHELNKKRKMFKNCFNVWGSKEDLSSEAVGSRLSQCSFPTSEISLELDYYDYLTPLSPKAPFVIPIRDPNSAANGDGNSNNL